MKDYNDITMMSLEYFLAEKGTLEWLLTGVTGRAVSLAPDLEVALPWEDITSTPDIRATSQDEKEVYLVHIGNCAAEDKADSWLRRIAEGEDFSFQEVHSLLFLDGRRDGFGIPAYCSVMRSVSDSAMNCPYDSPIQQRTLGQVASGRDSSKTRYRGKV